MLKVALQLAHQQVSQGFVGHNLQKTRSACEARDEQTTRAMRTLPSRLLLNGNLMKLYYSPGACSLSVHMALHEAAMTFSAIKAPTKTHLLEDGTDYYSINPLGYVPLLELDDGTRLTEASALLQHIADQVPALHLAPSNGGTARAQMNGWLAFISSELHKGFAPLFNPATPADYKPMVMDKLIGRLTWVDSQLAGKQYLVGDAFSVADLYLFNVTGWAPMVKVDISGLANIAAFRAHMAARPAVQAAMRAEGLIK